MTSQEAFTIVLTLLASAFFSGVEIAYVSANKLYFELQAKQGVITGQIIAGFLKKPSQFIGTMLIGNTLALVLYGIFMEGWLHEVFRDALEHLPPVFQFLDNPFVQILLPALVATILVLAVAEFVPKSLFLLNPDVFLEVLAIPIWLLYYAMSPLVWAIVNLSRWFLTNVLRLEYSETRPVFGLTDLNEYLQNLNRTDTGPKKEDVAEVDTKIFNNALEFREVRVGDCLIPRTEIVAVDVEDGMAGLKKSFVESGHSRVLVYRETIEDVLGYVHSLALFKKPKDVKTILTPIPIVPEAMPAQDLLVKFTQERKSMALVVDEFGGTSGLVTLEDLVEQIFGEIKDEYDEPEEGDEQRLDDRNYVFSARLKIDYLNEKYGWELPEGDRASARYDTLGGMIIAINENIPRVNEVVIYEPFTFTILSMKDARIEKVKVTITGNFGG